LYRTPVAAAEPLLLIEETEQFRVGLDLAMKVEAGRAKQDDGPIIGVQRSVAGETAQPLWTGEKTAEELKAVPKLLGLGVVDQVRIVDARGEIVARAQWVEEI